jgi:hypothetical protein
MIEVGPILRLAGGDNRALPVRASYGLKLEVPPSEEPDTGRVTLEELTVAELARRITRHPDAKPLLVVLYYSGKSDSPTVFPFLVEIARGCRAAGADVLALSVDKRPDALRRLPGFLRKHAADFPPLHLQPWPSGHLSGSLDPLGFQIGSAFGTPLAAVRKNRAVDIQLEGAAQITAYADHLITACQNSRVNSISSSR